VLALRLLSLALALGLVAPPTRAGSRSRDRGGEPPDRTPERQPRRQRQRVPLSYGPERSPGGLHVVEIEDGVILIDGLRVHPLAGSVQVLHPPVWRADGDAVAWLERRRGETRLVVLPSLRERTQTIVWPLPPLLGRDLVHWAGDNRIIVGPKPLEPRAVASWSE
jgi:hypothetical protein